MAQPTETAWPAKTNGKETTGPSMADDNAAPSEKVYPPGSIDSRDGFGMCAAPSDAPTPRTNGLLGTFYLKCDDCPQPEKCDRMQSVHPDDARQIERELYALQAKLDAAHWDAWRYRWLREHADNVSVDDGETVYWLGLAYGHLSRELDAAIDDAMYPADRGTDSAQSATPRSGRGE